MNAYIVIGSVLLAVSIGIGVNGAKNLLEWKSGKWCAAAWGTVIPALALLGYGIWRTTL